METTLGLLLGLDTKERESSEVKKVIEVVI